MVTTALSPADVEPPIPREAIALLENRIGRSLEGWDSCPPLFVSPMPDRVEGAYFDIEAVARVVAAFRYLRHTKGRWAGVPFEPEPWQIVWVLAPVFGWKRSDGRRIIQTVWWELPRKNGKALDINTPIPTPDGWTPMGDLRQGDTVFDERGQPCNIVAAMPIEHNRPCYRVSFSDGTSIVADAEHEWFTIARRTGRQRGQRWIDSDRITTTAQIAATLRVESPSNQATSRIEWNHAVPVATALSLPDAELPIPPYVLGAWLGDGTADTGAITCGYSDLEIIQQIESEGVPTRERASSNANSGLFRLGAGGNSQAERNASVAARLRRLGVLSNKHIPSQYLRASSSQRLALLQGLMDTDGYVSVAGQCEFTTTDDRLRDGFLDLVRGLGYKPTVKTDRALLYGKDCGPKYRVQFWAFEGQAVFRLPRKLARLKQPPSILSPRSRTRQIVAVEPVDSVPVRCIQVDSPSHLYLAGDGMIPTHNSTAASAIALVLLAADGESGAEVYAAAASRDQARIVFGESKKMAAASGALRGKVRLFASSIFMPKSGSTFRVLSKIAEVAHGLNVSGAIVDEVHVHKSRDLIDALETGTGAREQPLVLFITTADEGDTQSIYAEKHEYAQKCARGAVQDSTFWGVIWAAEETDDPYAEATWRKANPGYGVTVRPEWIRKEAAKAKETPSYYATFLRLILNRRVRMVARWLPLSDWDASAGLVRENELAGRECYAGLDLASTTDLAALALLFPMEDGTIRALWRIWVPEATVIERTRRDNVPYEAWVRQGWITATEGNVIDYDVIRRTLTGVHVDSEGKATKVTGLADQYRIAELGFDPWNATQLVTQLQGDGLTCVPVRQGYATLSAPTKELQKRVLARRFVHGGNPVARWCADNMVLSTDPAGNIKPNKEHSPEKIDPLVAAVVAMDRLIRHEQAGVSYLETEGVLFL